MKNTNFKKVLAIVLSLAMMLSVCTMGFSVSAETTATEDTSNVANDLSYYVMNDATEDNGWEGHNNVATRDLNGRKVYRVTAINTASAAQFGVKNNIGSLTADDFANVNTVSMYVNNATGETLQFAYDYYIWTSKDPVLDEEGNPTYNEDGSAIVQYNDWRARLSNGYVYLLDPDTAEMLPYKTDAYGNVKIPAGFEGYLIYDFSNSANYGNASSNKDGDLGASIDWIKAKAFQGMQMFVKNTENMLTAPWYFGEVAISDKSVDELAEYITGKLVTYTFNQANATKGENSVVTWNKMFDTVINASHGGPGTIVDYDGMENQGLKFTTSGDGNGSANTLNVSNNFKNSMGTTLPFAIENAKGIAIRMEKVGDINFHFYYVAQANKLQGTWHFVSDDGVYTTGTALISSDFKGTAYFIFSETEAYLEDTWYNAVVNNGAKNIGYYAHKPSNDSTSAGATLTFGSFSFIYDTDFASQIDKNPTFIDGTCDYTGWFRPKNGFVTNATQYSRMTGNRVNDKFVFTMFNAVDDNCDYLYFTTGVNGISGNYTVESPENVKGVSFEIKVDGIPDGTYKAITPALVGSNRPGFLGSLKAISYDGTVVATYETTAVRVDTDETVAGGTLESTNQKSSLMVPAGFEGIIIMEFDNDALVVDSYGATAGDKVYTFAEYISSVNGGVIKSMSDIGGFYDADGKAVYLPKVTYAEITYDNFKLIYDDIDTYVEDYNAPAAIAARVAEKTNSTDSVYDKAYTINNGSKTNGQSMAWYNFLQSSLACTEVGHLDENKTSYTVYASTTGTGADGSIALGTRVTDLSKYGIDISKAKALSYWTSIPQLEDGNYLRVHHSLNSLTTVATVIAISDDGETVIINKGNNHAGNLNGFTGRIYYLFDEDFSITYNDVAYSWEDYVNKCEEEIAAGTRTDAPFTKIKLYGARGKSVVDTETLFCFDDYKLHFEDDMLKDALAKVNMDAIFSARDDINPALETNGWYTVAPEAVEAAPNGTAIHFAQIDGAEVSGDVAYQLPNKTCLSATEQLANEAVSFWVSVPETQADGMSFWPRFAGEGNYYSGTFITVDQNTGAVTYTSYPENSSYTLKLPAGFTGYVILPIKYAQLAQSYGTNLVDLTTALSTTGLGNITFYWNTSSGTEWYFGEVDFVSNIADFMTDLGVAQLSGDINADNAVDVRDIIRLKKFNADSRYSIAFQNADIDGNGKFDTAAELIASRKQLLDIDYIDHEYDYPETLVGLYHHTYGDWDSKYADVIAEDDIVNTYITSDYYELKEIAANGDAAWLLLSRSIGGAPIFVGEDGKYSSTVTVINDAYIEALDAKVQKMKDLGVWNAVIGFHSEEILMGQVMTNEQFAIWTKYLSETYGKRFFACLSAYENKGGTHSYNDDKIPVTVPRADYETYQYVTDIGFDDYDELYPDIKSALEGLMTNVALSNDGETVYDRSDMKYWLFPTAFTNCATADSTLVDEDGKVIEGTTSNGNGKPAADDAKIAAYIADYDLVFSEIPEAQRGGLMFYTWTTWEGSYGLEDLIEDYGYTQTRDALIALASKYVD